jgi:hypothetical protein
MRMAPPCPWAPRVTRLAPIESPRSGSFSAASQVARRAGDAPLRASGESRSAGQTSSSSSANGKVTRVALHRSPSPMATRIPA